MREEPCPCGRCRQGIRRLRRSGQRSPPVREELRLYVRGSCGFPAIPVRAESARRTAGAGSGGIRRQRAASGVPSAILRHSLRWFWRPVCFWKAFRTPCDAAPCFWVCPFPAPHRAQDYHPAGAQGRTVGERGGASYGGAAGNSRALVDAAEIYYIIIFIMLILCRFML